MFKYMFLVISIMLVVAYIVYLLWKYDILLGDKWYKFYKFLVELCLLLFIITTVVMVIEFLFWEG